MIMGTIDVHELNGLRTNDLARLRIIDIRTEHESMAGAIPFSISMPIDKMEMYIGSLRPNLKYVFYSAASPHSEEVNALRKLATQGYSITVLHGGFEAWTAEELPVTVGPQMHDCISTDFGLDQNYPAADYGCRR